MFFSAQQWQQLQRQLPACLQTFGFHPANISWLPCPVQEQFFAWKRLAGGKNLRHRRAHGSSLLGLTGMSHGGDTCSPQRWGLEQVIPKGAPDAGVNPRLMGICLHSHPSKRVSFGSPHAQRADCPPYAPKSCTAPRVLPAAPEGPYVKLSLAMSHLQRTHLHVSSRGAPTWDRFAEAVIPARNQ